MTPPAYAPLNEAAMLRDLKLIKSMHCCRPVVVDGRQEFIHTVSAAQAGGRIETLVYLTGNSTPVLAEQVIIQPQPE
jgi:hypothetical protein